MAPLRDVGVELAQPDEKPLLVALPIEDDRAVADEEGPAWTRSPGGSSGACARGTRVGLNPGDHHAGPRRRVGGDDRLARTARPSIQSLERPVRVPHVKNSMIASSTSFAAHQTSSRPSGKWATRTRVVARGWRTA